jgi:phosphoglycolate phosphatase-like HAD superfamily hydrolase
VLLLFDIDGTLLVGAAEAHRDAMHAALRAVYGIGAPEAAPVQAAGRTDFEIARAICVHSGVEAGRIDAGLPALREALAEEYARRIAGVDLRAHVAPGVVALLEELAGRDGTRLSLVTGNLEAVARLKLRAAGLGSFFPAGQGGFGSDHEDRVMLPPIARRRAGAPGPPHPRERTVVIGDTPRDIACARADGLRCVAVAGGPYRAEALSEADAVVADPTSLLAALDGLE